MTRVVAIAVVVAAVVAAGGCTSEGGGDGGEGGVGDAAADVDSAEEGSEGGGDGGSEAVPGPLTFVATEVLVVDERRCDLDGDGDADNAVSDLGSPAASLFARALEAEIAAFIDGTLRACFHFARVNDVAAPSEEEAPLVVFFGADADEPEDPSDDLDGGEAFFARPLTLDGCGEPRLYFPAARIDDGALVAEDGLFPIPITWRSYLLGRGARLEGRVEPFGVSAEGTVCLYVTIADAGALESSVPGLSMLEQLLSGGESLGVPTIPGLEADLDLDGDGLERFLLDAELHLQSCIDGDSTVIDGRDCWQDPRMADAFSMTVAFSATWASYAGRAEGWEDAVEGSCEDGPPEPSLWGPAMTPAPAPPPHGVSAPCSIIRGR